MYREKAGRELHQNVTSDFEQIIEATPHGTTAVQPLTFQHGLMMMTFKPKSVYI